MVSYPDLLQVLTVTEIYGCTLGQLATHRAMRRVEPATRDKIARIPDGGQIESEENNQTDPAISLHRTESDAAGEVGWLNDRMVPRCATNQVEEQVSNPEIPYQTDLRANN